MIKLKGMKIQKHVICFPFFLVIPSSLKSPIINPGSDLLEPNQINLLKPNRSFSPLKSP